MLKILAFLTRRQDLETKVVVEHDETKHIPLISLAPAQLVYKRNYLVRGNALNLDDGTTDFEVVTEIGRVLFGAASQLPETQPSRDDAENYGW
jgi:hypothetical protein